jgi:hypothetical protein
MMSIDEEIKWFEQEAWRKYLPIEKKQDDWKPLRVTIGVLLFVLAISLLSMI